MDITRTLLITKAPLKSLISGKQYVQAIYLEVLESDLETLPILHRRNPDSGWR
jgi:hypothetical protein